MRVSIHNNTEATLSSAALAAELSSHQWEVWIGWCGCDTRPSAIIRDEMFAAPVAHTVGFADGRPEYEVPEGDLLGFLQDVPLWHVLLIPDFWGGSREGVTILHKGAHDEWVFEQYVDYNFS